MSPRSLAFTPEARRDLQSAVSWYEDAVRGLGSEFVRAVDAASAEILRFPEAASPVHHDVRKRVLRRFPYSLLYKIEAESIIVLACFHHRRDPTAWRRDGSN